MVHFIIFTALFLGCDVIHNFQSEEMDLDVSIDPKEVIHIESSNSASPTLNKIIISKSNKDEKGKLLFLLCADIPNAEILSRIYEMSLDSLSQISSFSVGEISTPFYVLGLIDLHEKDSVIYQLDRPIVWQNNYVIAVPSKREMEIKISLGFQRLHDNTEPKVKKIQI